MTYHDIEVRVREKLQLRLGQFPPTPTTLKHQLHSRFDQLQSGLRGRPFAAAGQSRDDDAPRVTKSGSHYDTPP